MSTRKFSEGGDPTLKGSAAVNAGPKKFPVPWGLFIVLAVYAGAVVFYVWATYWSSPDYLSAQHYARAVQLLGADDGRKCPPADLLEAYKETLEAARLKPEIAFLQERTQALRFRFEERKIKLPPDLVMRAEAVANVHARIQEERKPWLVVSQRDRGWAADQVLAGPTTVFLVALPGAVVIVLIWAWGRLNQKKIRATDREADLKQQEAALADRERIRQESVRAEKIRRTRGS